jgi:hypothetical protein
MSTSTILSRSVVKNMSTLLEILKYVHIFTTVFIIIKIGKAIPVTGPGGP